eukprot:scaffold844_cov254-Pinguiococcus_pyrenoidosus.AAC.5
MERGCCDLPSAMSCPSHSSKTTKVSRAGSKKAQSTVCSQTASPGSSSTAHCSSMISCAARLRPCTMIRDPPLRSETPFPSPSSEIASRWTPVTMSESS